MLVHDLDEPRSCYRLKVLRQDLLIAFFLALAASYGSWRGSGLLDARLFAPDASSVFNSGSWEGVFVRPHRADWIWFGADTTNVFLTVAEPNYNQGMTARHPLFALAARLPVRGILLARPVPLVAVRALMALVSGIWILTFFCGLRLIPCRRLDAIVISAVVLTSASAMFWLVVPSPSVFASLSILLVFATVAAAERFKVGSGWFVVASAMAFSFTRSNWVVGALGTAMAFPWKRTVQLTANAFACVLVLWAMEKLVFPTAAVPFLWKPAAFTQKEPPAVRLVDSVSSIVNGVVVPPIALKTTAPIDRPALTIKSSSAGEGSIFGTTAVFCWLLLLGLGLWSIVTIKEHVHLRIFLTIVLIFRLAVQIIQGGETFRLSLESTPIVVLLIGFAVFTRLRALALALACLLALSGGVHNALQLERAAAAVRVSLESTTVPARP